MKNHLTFVNLLKKFNFNSRSLRIISVRVSSARGLESSLSSLYAELNIRRSWQFSFAASLLRIRFLC